MKIIVKDRIIINKDEYYDFISNLSDWQYIIKKYIPIRTTPQNKYYRWLLTIVEQETWQEKEDIHEKMKMKFLYVPWSWKQLPYCRSTSQLNTSDFCDYIENIKNFMSEFGIILPSAEEFENYM
jgi:hypothetical protein